jgi:hypothetical protein
MSLLPRLCLLFALTGLASGCQVGAPVPGPDDVTPNAVTGDAIEVTALDAPPPAAAQIAAAELAAVPAGKAASTTPEAEPLVPVSGTAEVPAADATAVETPATSTAEAAPEAAEAIPPPPPKSDRQIACERKRGTWEDTGGGLMICIQPTRDGGKRCTRESQCEGLCLARSGTCAPVRPLLGCHDILQDDGSRATQCIE